MEMKMEMVTATAIAIAMAMEYVWEVVLSVVVILAYRSLAE